MRWIQGEGDQTTTDRSIGTEISKSKNVPPGEEKNEKSQEEKGDRQKDGNSSGSMARSPHLLFFSKGYYGVRLSITVRSEARVRASDHQTESEEVKKTTE